jgi:hypothetical protein
VDVILCETKKLGLWSVQQKALEIAPRGVGDLRERPQDRAAPQRAHRRRCWPSWKASRQDPRDPTLEQPPDNPLDFRTAAIRVNTQRGYDDAKKVQWT